MSAIDPVYLLHALLAFHRACQLILVATVAPVVMRPFIALLCASLIMENDGMYIQWNTLRHEDV